MTLIYWPNEKIHYGAFEKWFFSWATESRKRPPLPPPRSFASYKFVHALDRLFVTFARTSEPLVCLLGPSETHFFPTGGFFVGNRVPKATPTAPTARFCIAQVRTRVGSTFRDVCAHGRAVGVSTGSLRNSLFPQAAAGYRDIAQVHRG